MSDRLIEQLVDRIAELQEKVADLSEREMLADAWRMNAEFDLSVSDRNLMNALKDLIAAQEAEKFWEVKFEGATSMYKQISLRHMESMDSKDKEIEGLRIENRELQESRDGWRKSARRYAEGEMDALRASNRELRENMSSVAQLRSDNADLCKIMAEDYAESVTLRKRIADLEESLEASNTVRDHWSECAKRRLERIADLRRENVKLKSWLKRAQDL